MSSSLWSAFSLGTHRLPTRCTLSKNGATITLWPSGCQVNQALKQQTIKCNTMQDEPHTMHLQIYLYNISKSLNHIISYIPVVPGQAGGGSFQKEKNYIAQKEFAYRMCARRPTSAMPKSFLCCERAFCRSMVVMFCALKWSVLMSWCLLRGQVMWWSRHLMRCNGLCCVMSRDAMRCHGDELYYSSTMYYKVYTTPILLRTTNTTLYYSSTTLCYKVLLKYYSSTTLYYKVLLQY